MRWTRAVLLTRAPTCGRRSRVVLTPRRWRQVRGGIRGRRWQESPVTGESTKETVKTIARGMPDDFRCDRGDYARVLCFLLHARLRRIVRPAFPAPSQGKRTMHNSGESRRGNARSCLQATTLFDNRIGKICTKIELSYPPPPGEGESSTHRDRFSSSKFNAAAANACMLASRSALPVSSVMTCDTRPAIAMQL